MSFQTILDFISIGFSVVAIVFFAIVRGDVRALSKQLERRR